MDSDLLTRLKASGHWKPDTNGSTRVYRIVSDRLVDEFIHTNAYCYVCDADRHMDGADGNDCVAFSCHSGVIAVLADTDDELIATMLAKKMESAS